MQRLTLPFSGPASESLGRELVRRLGDGNRCCEDRSRGGSNSNQDSVTASSGRRFCNTASVDFSTIGFVNRGGSRTMIENRSLPADTVLPHVTYRDLAKAIAWLGKAFDFREHYRY